MHWRQYEITGDVAPDAQAVYLGALLVGQGQVWMDAASLGADPSVAAPEAGGPVTERGLAKSHP